MVTVFTKDECIQFNLKDMETEKSFVSSLKYHMKNDTNKDLKINSKQFKGGVKRISPDDVTDVYWENREYDESVGNEIDRLINELP